jgi:ribonuclease HII
MALAKTKKKKLQKKLFSENGISKKKFSRTYFSTDQIKSFNNLLKHDEAIYNLYDSLLIGLDEVGRGCVAGPVYTAGYSCSNFYINTDELIQEVSLSRQLISEEFLNTNIRSAYYSETVVNEYGIEDNLNEVEELSTLLSLEDSKKVPKNKRETLCRSLLDLPCFFEDSHIFHNIHSRTASDIDQTGIVDNIWKSMVSNVLDIVEQYIELYKKKPKEITLLVDGPKTIPNFIALIKKIQLKQGNADLEFIELGKNNNQTQLNLKDPDQRIKVRQLAIVKGDSKSALIAAASNLAKLERDIYMAKLGDRHEYKKYIWSQNVGYGTKKHLEAILEYGITTEHRKSFLGNYLSN